MRNYFRLCTETDRIYVQLPLKRTSMKKCAILAIILLAASVSFSLVDQNSVTRSECLLITIREIKCINIGLEKISNLKFLLNQSLSKSDLKFKNLNLNEKGANELFPNNESKNWPHLEQLNLDDNNLVDFSIYGPNLKVLSLSRNKLEQLNDTNFETLNQLIFLNLNGNLISKIAKNTFSKLKNLKTLILSQNKQLKTLPDLSGTSSLDYLYLDRCGLEFTEDPDSIYCPNLRSLDLKSNFLQAVPNLRHCNNLGVLNLAHNQIRNLGENSFKGLDKLLDLLLNHNGIERILNYSFYGLVNLQILDLGNNKISLIDDEAFGALKKLRSLNLGNNLFRNLPTKGLTNLQTLKAHNNGNFRDFPDCTLLPNIRTLALSYAYHCCAFLNENDCNNPIDDRPKSLVPLTSLALSSSTLASSSSFKETVFFPHNLSKLDFEKLWNLSRISWNPKSDTSSLTVLSNTNAFEPYTFGFRENFTRRNRIDIPMTHNVKCLPLPGPFQPCRDLFDWWTLRCGVWVIFLLSLLGNGIVVVVLLFARTKLDVPRFLVCNLAMADFCMSIYLGILAFVDAATIGEFRKHAIPWQMSVGCKTAGFFGVFSTELSVFTLSVITLERNYAITHAMHLNKRLTLRNAVLTMLFGWMFALIMATLPLYGVSDYRKFAVCLPFETKDSISLSYILVLISTNGLAFFILMGCYLRMYCAIRGSQAWNSNDSRIAKRMSLLVFSNFLCWSPIAFFTLTALMGYPLLSLEGAKVLTVFILPLNSCCNPFLYAIITKQFKKDCVMICKTLEDSKISRGIGRHGRNSNFSNRLTPATTDSLHDHSSQDNTNSCGAKKSLLIISSSDDENSSKLVNLFRQKKKSPNFMYQIAQNQSNSSKNSGPATNQSKNRVPPTWLNRKQRQQQPLNDSSSRNDSSSGRGSLNTQSNGSSSSSFDPKYVLIQHESVARPKLKRQTAADVDDEIELNTCFLQTSTNKLTVRFVSAPSSTTTAASQNVPSI